MRFSSKVKHGAVMAPFTQEQVKLEPMLFNCSIAAANHLGGPITREFISRLRPEYLHGIIDTRVHMLMPGWWPCIPGWHHDDVPRSTATGQPNYATPEYKARHCLALVNAAICPTEFLLGDIEVPEPDTTRVIYKEWDDYLQGPGRYSGSKLLAPDRQLLYFDADTFHRGTQATAAGWRWFGRVSIDTQRIPTDEVRQQVQVYLSVVNGGW